MDGKIDEKFLYYVAGFFDGEGSISYAKGKKFAIEICIANTNREVIELLHKCLGLGYIDVQVPKKPNWSTKYSFRIRNLEEVEKFLTLIADKVVVKKEKVREALAKIKEYKELVLKYEKMKQEIAELYRQGVPINEIASRFNISRQRVCQIAREFGLVRHRFKNTKLNKRPKKPRPQSWERIKKIKV